MSIFTDYEKHHLHNYVDKKGELFSKGEIDNKLALLKAQSENHISTSILTAINQLKSETSALIIQFINQQVIPTTNYTWIKLLHKDDIDGVDDLTDIIVLNVFIKCHQRFHHAKSDHVDAAFTNLEFFYNAHMTGYYTYFDSFPSN